MLGGSVERRLIEAAIEQFGQSGMNAVGTRAIADAAGVQMSAITYHFGGKGGLYLACARHIVEQISVRVERILSFAASQGTDPGDIAGARAAVLAIMGGLATAMMRDEIAPLARFVLREQMNPSPAFEIIHEGYMRRILDQMGRLLQRVAGGTLKTEELRVRSIALMGQAFVFRFSRAALMRATGWQSIGEPEAMAVRAAVLAHSEAILDALQSGGWKSTGP
jgi:TetR/AcrR family transcriptional regulator, regulator of cefoperazone and chloramphenicol sensitivity